MNRRVIIREQTAARYPEPDPNALPGMRAWAQNMTNCVADGMSSGDISPGQAVAMLNHIQRNVDQAEIGIASLRNSITKDTP